MQIVFAFSWLSIPWIYPPEITPLNIRHIGAASATSAEWLTAFLISEVTPIAVTNIGFYYYIVFAVVCAASVPIVYLFYPETAGRTLEEIDTLFASGSVHGGDFKEVTAEKMHEDLMKKADVSFVERSDGSAGNSINV